MWNENCLSSNFFALLHFPILRAVRHQSAGISEYRFARKFRAGSSLPCKTRKFELFFSIR